MKYRAKFVCRVERERRERIGERRTDYKYVIPYVPTDIFCLFHLITKPTQASASSVSIYYSYAPILALNFRFRIQK